MSTNSFLPRQPVGTPPWHPSRANSGIQSWHAWKEVLTVLHVGPTCSQHFLTGWPTFVAIVRMQEGFVEGCRVSHCTLCAKRGTIAARESAADVTVRTGSSSGYTSQVSFAAAASSARPCSCSAAKATAPRMPCSHASQHHQDIIHYAHQEAWGSVNMLQQHCSRHLREPNPQLELIC